MSGAVTVAEFLKSIALVGERTRELEAQAALMRTEPFAGILARALNAEDDTLAKIRYEALGLAEQLRTDTDAHIGYGDRRQAARSIHKMMRLWADKWPDEAEWNRQWEEIK